MHVDDVFSTFNILFVCILFTIVCFCLHFWEIKDLLLYISPHYSLEQAAFKLNTSTLEVNVNLPAPSHFLWLHQNKCGKISNTVITQMADCDHFVWKEVLHMCLNPYALWRVHGCFLLCWTNSEIVYYFACVRYKHAEEVQSVNQFWAWRVPFQFERKLDAFMLSWSKAKRWHGRTRLFREQTVTFVTPKTSQQPIYLLIWGLIFLKYRIDNTFRCEVFCAITRWT